jgi:CDP-6-deoxy-D-xylo-4-hexulose-3-dehydrase
MNLSDIEDLRRPLENLLAKGSRANSNKPEQYWYPLSMATYDIEEILQAIDSLCSFRTTMWDKTIEFERAFAAVSGVDEAVMVNSGSSADLLIAFAMANPGDGRLHRGDEVVVPAVTWPTHVWSLLMAGLDVRLVDVDPATLGIRADAVEAVVSERTRAVFPAHLMGNPCDIGGLQTVCERHDLLLLEDCCESLGAKYRGRQVGSFGLASSFSFFFSHHLTTMEGGMVCTRDAELSDLFRVLRAHGWARNLQHSEAPSSAELDPRYSFVNWGFNVRPTELQAGFGLMQLAKMTTFHRQRVENAEYIVKAFADHSNVLRPMAVTPEAECSWFAIPILVTPEAPFTRGDITAWLELNGVETRPIVAGNLVRQPVSRELPGLSWDDLSGADAVHDRGFYVGVHPVEEPDTLDRLVELVSTFVAMRI